MVAEFGDGDVVSPIGGSVNLGQAFGPLMLAYGQLVDQLGRGHGRFSSELVAISLVEL